MQATTLNDPTPDDSYLLMAAHASGIVPNLTTAVYARRLVQWQRDGHWTTSDFRPPHSSSVFTATATAVRAISLYGPLMCVASVSSRRAGGWSEAPDLHRRRRVPAARARLGRRECE